MKQLGCICDFICEFVDCIDVPLHDAPCLTVAEAEAKCRCTFLRTCSVLLLRGGGCDSNLVCLQVVVLLAGFARYPNNERSSEIE